MRAYRGLTVGGRIRVVSARDEPNGLERVDPCYKPDGSISRTIELPVGIPKSVMFGGANLDVLYVTTLGMKILGMEPGPDGGALFAVNGLGVKGKSEPRFAG